MSNSESLRQAALVLKTLPKGEAARIMSKLEPAEIRKVLNESHQLEEPDLEETLTLLNQLALEAESLRTDSDFHRQQLNQQLREGIPADEYVDAGPFRFLIHLAPDLRRDLLADEHPENVALVMMFLPSYLGSDLLRNLDSPTQVSALRRLCAFEDVTEEQISDLAFNLKMRLQSKLQRKEKLAGVQLAGHLLSCSDEETRDQVLEYLNQLDPGLVDELQQSMFRFEDLQLLDRLDIQVILKNVDTSYWAPALKGASLKVRAKVLGCMAPKVARILSSEIEALHSMDTHISNQAQMQIVNVCFQLDESGKIDLPCS